jgi:hypothetical protein
MRPTSPIKRPAVKTPASKNRIEKPLSQAAPPKEDFHKKVQEVAYELFVARGCAHGFDVEDWVAAEQIVRGS